MLEDWKIADVVLGRAIYTLETTLPTFFQAGLVSIAVQEDVINLREQEAGGQMGSQGLPESIYAPNIRLSYTPPAAFSLPAAFPRTLQVEG